MDRYGEPARLRRKLGAVARRGSPIRRSGMVHRHLYNDLQRAREPDHRSWQVRRGLEEAAGWKLESRSRRLQLRSGVRKCHFGAAIADPDAAAAGAMSLAASFLRARSRRLIMMEL